MDEVIPNGTVGWLDLIGSPPEASISPVLTFIGPRSSTGAASSIGSSSGVAASAAAPAALAFLFFLFLFFLFFLFNLRDLAMLAKSKLTEAVGAAVDSGLTNGSIVAFGGAVGVA